MCETQKAILTPCEDFDPSSKTRLVLLQSAHGETADPFRMFRRRCRSQLQYWAVSDSKKNDTNTVVALHVNLRIFKRT